jgi:hypothetical protein
MNITQDERLNLKKLMSEMDYEDNTHNIRSLKHSVLIRDDVRKLEGLKKQHSDIRISNPEEFATMAQSECSFLFSNYTDIFTRLMKDELDVTILTKLLIVLKLIEDEKLDQQEGSVMVGRYLKELYLDSAVKRADNIDKEQEANEVPKVEGLQVSWKEYKKSLR